MTSDPSAQEKIQRACEFIEGGAGGHLVRLRSSLQLTLSPGQEMELHCRCVGVSASDIQLHTRAADLLPKHLVVLVAEVQGDVDPSVRVVVRNSATHTNIVLTHCDVLAEVSSSKPVSLLVGPSCQSDIVIEGVQTKCLLDSGSQITLISESFYKEHLSHLTLEPISQLKVTGAGGHIVPYLGFVQCELKLPTDVVGVDSCVNSLVLVSPDTDYSKSVPIIVGTNTLRAYTEMCKQTVGGNYAFTLPLRPEVNFMYHDLNTGAQGRLGSARLVGSNVVIPPGEVAEVRCKFHGNVPNTRSAVLCQEPTEQKLPEGVEVVASRIPTYSLHNAKLCVVNTSDCDILLKKNQIVADVFVIYEEYDFDKILDSSDEKDDVHVGSHSTHVDVDSENVETGIKFKFDENAPEDWKKEFAQKLQSYGDVFKRTAFDVGQHNSGFEFDIEVDSNFQYRQRARPVSPQDFEDCRSHIQGLLDANIIRPSNSPYASPIVLCRKKSGALRLVCDYRVLNSKTVKDAYSLPKVEDLLVTLSGAKCFTSMDLCNAYYQIPMSSRASKLSAFSTVFGNYEWTRMSQGLANAPACFQRLMETMFRDMNLVELIIFLDDLLVHGQTWEELGDRTLKVLDRLRKFNLKLDPEKCVFGAKEIKHLGYIISEGSIRPDPDKVATVKTWPKPETVKDVKRIVGFANYYRRFIPNFSSMVKPLNDLTVGYVPSKRGKANSKKRGVSVLQLSSDISHLWSEKQEKAFEDVKHVLTSDLVLGLADKSKMFYLHCDASGIGIGAVLYQEIDGKMKVISYASRGLNKSEQNYPAHKREFLALKWAMTDKFHDYLYGSRVIVVTDNNPLCYVLKNAKLDATSHRWLTTLSLYDFELRYKRGETHIDADSLSRRPQEPAEEDDGYKRSMEKISFLVEKAKAFDSDTERELVFTSVNSDCVHAIINSHCVRSEVHCYSQSVGQKIVDQQEQKLDQSNEFICAAEQLIRDPDLISNDKFEPDFGKISTISNSQWRTLQLSDKNLKLVIESLKAKKKLVAADLDSSELKVFAREQEKLVIVEGVLYRKVSSEGEADKRQLVLPFSHRKEALKGVHDDLFHTSYDNAIAQLRARFYWPYMGKDLEKKIKRCTRCIRRGAAPQKAPMNSITTTFPLELLSIDYLTIEVKGKKENVLVIIDHFTKFGAAFCTKDQTAKTVAKTLWKEFFLVYGFPKKILSDQGRDFESQIVSELCKVAGIQKIRTTPYHPCSNPVERWNRTLLNMLRSLEDEKKSDVRNLLPSAVHAYNCCIHSSTGFSPYYLFFGRHPRLPIDIAFGTDLNQKKGQSLRQHVQNMRDQLKKAYRLAEVNMEKSASKNKARYDVTAHAAELETGDRVLVRKLGPRLDSKLSDKWEKGVYTVISKPSEMPVYKVQLESGDGPIRTLHRNYLLPIGMLGFEDSVVLKQPRKNKTEHSKDRLIPLEISKSELTVSDNEQSQQSVELVIKGLPSQLRADAPVFTPCEPEIDESKDSMDSCEAEIRISNNQSRSVDLGTSEVLSESTEANKDDLFVSEKESVVSDESQDCRDDVHVHDDVRDVHVDDDVHVEDAGIRLRRSTRVRRPVNRMNLTHHAKRCGCGVKQRIGQAGLMEISRKVDLLFCPEYILSLFDKWILLHSIMQDVQFQLNVFGEFCNCFCKCKY